ncbi:MAG TPA: SMP-30/gluconolactonase/LRE family protein [Alphaproteobacteria bacterium]|nr:SMP-30/gluconolactonase/LRE family protein [Alphaproteobacteria bacterium]
MKRAGLWGLMVAGLLAVGAVSAVSGQARAAEAGADKCAPYGKMKFLCGVDGPEDLMPLPNTKWIISGGMAGQGHSGHFYLIDAKAKTFEVLFPGDDPHFMWDKKMFGTCPGPLDVKNFSAHGLSLRPEAEAGHYKMYITSHGAREAVEAFDLDATGAKPSLTWIGCVVLPPKTFSNSVAILPDGGFVVTKFMDPTVKNAFAGIMQGKVTGVVYEWHPGDAAVKPVPGTEGSGPNGIALSPDGKTMYLAMMGIHEVIKYSLGEKPMKESSVKLDILPDNLRWTSDGMLLAAGGVAGRPPAGGGSAGWKVVEINPKTMEATTKVIMDGKSPIPTISVGVMSEGAMWVGSPRGDRVGYINLK